MSVLNTTQLCRNPGVTMAQNSRLSLLHSITGILMILGLLALGTLYSKRPSTTGGLDSQVATASLATRKVSFALVGKLDMDHDGNDDRESLKTRIADLGGEVSLELSSDGDLRGELNDQTRWIVLGDGSESTAREEILAQAKMRGVSRISLSKFVDYLDYREE